MTTTKERPLLFSGPMVRAILDGRKTVTRRLLKPQPVLSKSKGGGMHWHLTTRTGFVNSADEQTWPATMTQHHRDQDGNVYPAVCPYGADGDRLWVKETWRPRVVHVCAPGECDCDDVVIRYAADDAERYVSASHIPDEWRFPLAAKRGNVSPLLMPRWASRLTLEVTGVRVERLHEITDADAIREGVREQQVGSLGAAEWGATDDAATWRPDPVSAFRALWESINGAESWDSNPWAWCLDFRKVEG